MLVLARQRDETIEIGDRAQTSVILSPADEAALKGCTDPALQDLAARLLDPTNRGVVLATVVDIRGDKVRIGLAGPRGVAFNRREVAESIRREGRHVQLQPNRVVKHGVPLEAGR